VTDAFPITGLFVLF